MKEWLLERAKERSTWIGLVAIAGVLCVDYSPENWKWVFSASVVAIAIISIITKDVNVDTVRDLDLHQKVDKAVERKRVHIS